MSDSGGVANGGAPGDAVLSVRDLVVEFTVGQERTRALDGASLDVKAGETVVLVGESGSGKSTLARAVMRMLPQTAQVSGGSIVLDGRDILAMKERELRSIRGRVIGLIPQDPMVSLNPLHRIGRQVVEPVVVHGPRLAGPERRVQAIRLLDRVGITSPALRIRQYPHELSGGMRQRVLIASALSAEPRLVVADEPTTALDVTVQRRILDDLDRLVGESGAAVLLVTHDLGVAADRADRIYVMRRGQIVESGPVRQVLRNAQDPYTRALVAVAPGLRASASLAGRQTTGRQSTGRQSTDGHGGGEAAADAADAQTGPGRSAGTGETDGSAVVHVQGVSKRFGRPAPEAGAPSAQPPPAVDDVDLTIAQGEAFGLVGESGSGKSTLARIIAGLTRPTSGTVSVLGHDLARLRAAELRDFHRRVQLIYQNPYGSLDPRMRVSDIIAEPLLGFRLTSKREAAQRVGELLDDVGLDRALLGRRPGELSGGQRQRVAIARALAPSPRLLICDEPTSAVDVAIQDQILTLLRRLQAEHDLTYLFISHDLSVISQLVSRVAVMRDGKIVEVGRVGDVFSHPRHEYTRELIGAIPGQRHKEWISV